MRRPRTATVHQGEGQAPRLKRIKRIKRYFYRRGRGERGEFSWDYHFEPLLMRRSASPQSLGRRESSHADVCDGIHRNRNVRNDNSNFLFYARGFVVTPDVTKIRG